MIPLTLQLCIQAKCIFLYAYRLCANYQECASFEIRLLHDKSHSVLLIVFRLISHILNIGGSRIFLGGWLKDGFIRMCTDFIAVKT